MLKKIDNLGRVVIPDTFRKEVGIRLNENLEMEVKGDMIILKKINKMLDQGSINYLYNRWMTEHTDSEYDRGFGDALKVILGVED